MEALKQSVQYVKGVGPKRAMRLNKLGIKTLQDVLYYFPRDYETWQGIKKVRDAVSGEEASFVVTFDGRANNQKPRKGLTLTTWRCRDETGYIWCVWFNQPYRARLYSNAKTYFVRGKVVAKYGMLQLHNPIVEEYLPSVHDVHKILPVYPLTEGISQKDLRNITASVLKRVEGRLHDEFPASVRKMFGLVEKNYALRHIHFPQTVQSLKAARRRLVFEELFYIKMALSVIRQKNHMEQRGLVFEWDQFRLDKFIYDLPFQLTNAQKRVVDEVLQDLKSGRVMNRLIQGDVGSGKTVIAAVGMYCAALSGYQSAMMAPTEILARQHFNSLKGLFENTDVKVECLVGGLKNAEKEQIKARLASGDIDMLIGTHAVIQDEVIFKKLGLVVTDEQHRFGVRQRAALKEKGQSPHMMVMSATPIPRTLALMLYGDLDVSIIDELPPGRKPVKTYHVPPSMKSRVLDFVKRQVAEGRQAYMVCPLVEESDAIDSQSAVELFESLRNGELANLRLGLLHGRMKPQEKERTMEAFAAGQVDVLISTTVIEVGVNVPNATLMVIENAERFGLAQLHQLRGRVGRGEHQAYCILIADAKTREVYERMKIMTKTNDGFEIAEKDLKLRGPGDFLGVKQHGLPEFKIVNLVRDMEILKEVDVAVNRILQDMDNPAYKALLEYTTDKFNKQLAEITLN
ncbi:MAG: ATP-dependent DNA helicase RecG [Clostridiales bacterium]|jgi:ATP-dependent DNA helicase RecG|nr:ATP-dependent DNA helicase RecG [Clostridiales bacterium]